MITRRKFIRNGALFVAAALMLCWVARAVVGMVRPLQPAYSLSDGFEETNTGGGLPSATDGYDDGQVASQSGTVNQDYSTSGLNLTGSQCLRLTTTGAFAKYILTNTQTAADFYFQIRPVALPGTQNIIFQAAQAGGAGTSPLALYLYADGTIKVFNGTSGSSQSVSAMSAGTTYAVWGTWSTNGTASAAFAAKTGSETRPTSGNAYVSVSGGNGTQAIERPSLEEPGAETIFDRFRMTSGAVIPDIP